MLHLVEIFIKILKEINNIVIIIMLYRHGKKEVRRMLREKGGVGNYDKRERENISGRV